MITVVVKVQNGAEALAATLAALVPGVAESVIADALVVAARHDPRIVAVADEMGAAVIVCASGADPWHQAARQARRDWLLLLEDGDVPAPGWIGPVGRFAALTGPDRGWGRLERPAPPVKRLKQALASVARKPRLRAGDLVRRAIAEGRQPLTGKPRPIAARIARDPAGA